MLDECPIEGLGIDGRFAIAKSRCESWKTVTHGIGTFLTRVFGLNQRRNGGPGRSRTADLRFRKPSLYPSELRGLADLAPLSHGVCKARISELFDFYRSDADAPGFQSFNHLDQAAERQNSLAQRVIAGKIGHISQAPLGGDAVVICKADTLPASPQISLTLPATLR